MHYFSALFEVDIKRNVALPQVLTD